MTDIYFINYFFLSASLVINQSYVCTVGSLKECVMFKNNCLCLGRGQSHKINSIL